MLYLDGYVLINFLMDVLLLWGTGTICKETLKRKRLCAAGMIGALYSAVFLFVRLNGILHIMTEFMGMSLLLTRVAFPYSSKKKWGTDAVVFCLLAFVTGGMLDAFYYAMGGGFVMRQGEKEITTIGMLSLAAGVIVLLSVSIRKREKRMLEEREYAEAEIVFPEGTILVTGLYDTGNRLRVQGRPVGVLEEETVQSILDPSRSFPIFYQSVGKRDGVLSAQKAVKIRIRAKEGEFVVLEPVIAFSQEKLSSDGTYRMLLPVEWRDV